jgi:hypothetical protein
VTGVRGLNTGPEYGKRHAPAAPAPVLVPQRVRLVQSGTERIEPADRACPFRPRTWV